MAFPLAHPSIVLPLAMLPKRYASLTGLVIGSLVPDLGYAAGIGGMDSLREDWVALFTFCLPVGLISAFVFHLFIRDRLIRILPKGLYLRFNRFLGTDWISHFRQYWPAVVVSLLIGAVSHMAWDSLDLTHNSGHVYRDLHAWTAPMNLGMWQIPIIRAIQHAPSVLGMLAIIIVIAIMPSSTLNAQRSTLNNNSH